MFKSALCLTLLAAFTLAASDKPLHQQIGRKPVKRADVPADLNLTEGTTTNAPAPHPTTNTVPVVSATPTNTPITVTNAVPLPAGPPSFTVRTDDWIALDRWARDNQMGGLTNLSLPGAHVFGLRTPGGEFVVRTGSVLALWSGLELRLGFEPRLVEDQPYLHRLDIEKNLVPLLVKATAPATGPRVIVLDPGHGGADSGTRSAQGDLEKDYTLDWAQRLATLLKTAGWKVFLTRTNDVQMSLTNRVAFADRHQADLFLSLHFNATEQPHHAGIETYCVTPMGMPSNVTRGYEDNPALVFPNNLFDAQNVQLALKLHHAVVLATDGNDRGVRRARFLTVLRGQNRPAALLEGGYLSNPDEAKLIVSAEYRQKLAEAVAKALQ